MIQRGSSDEAEARRHLARFQGMLKLWNEEADRYREAARGRSPAPVYLLEEADRSRDAIRAALEICDRLADDMAPGLPLYAEVLRFSATLEALSQSIAISAEQLGPRIAAQHDVVGLKFLVAALRENARLSP